MLEIAPIGLQGIFRSPALGTHHLQKPVHMPMRVVKALRFYLCLSFSWGKDFTTSDCSGGKFASPHTAP